MTGKAIQLMHEHYQPGADTGAQMLSHEAEEGGVIIRGKLEVTVGDQVRVLGPGDAYYFDSPHAAPLPQCGHAKRVRGRDGQLAAEFLTRRGRPRHWHPHPNPLP